MAKQSGFVGRNYLGYILAVLFIISEIIFPLLMRKVERNQDPSQDLIIYTKRITKENGITRSWVLAMDRETVGDVVCDAFRVRSNDFWLLYQDIQNPAMEKYFPYEMKYVYVDEDKKDPVVRYSIINEFAAS